uniref:NADH dehydrogenase subunit 6 n=1 Tax=Laqueus rubellus TaxID=93892 RepID=Q9MQZ7_LAQRU|nr:NADH dehydrogenase subunit 6 [Laqueus rubellus]BAA95920.1 NADH dehydrogenase subunit 6 [Laqueus rubellus]
MDYFGSVLIGLMVLFSVIVHPAGLGVSLLVVSLLCCLIVAVELQVWFSLVVFIIYIGGILVMFGYMTAMTPNFGGKGVVSVWSGLSVGLVVFLVGGFGSSGTSGVSLLEPEKNGSQVLEEVSFSILICYGGFLLMALLVVAMLCHYYKAPLRPFL